MDESVDFRGALKGGLISALILVLAACNGRGEPLVGGAPIESAENVLGVAYDEGSSELVLEMKPVDLPANSDHHGVQQPMTVEGPVPVGGWVNGYHLEVVDKDGQAVPVDVVHHVNIIVPGRRELFSQIMQRLGAAGTETAPVQMPRLIGYPLSRGDKVMLSAMLHNPTDKSYEGVRVRVRMPHIDGNAFIRPVRIYPFYLDVMPPAGIHEFDLPPGFSEKAWEGKPAVSGRMLAIGGHVHRYAQTLRLEDVTAGEVIYETQPILNEAGDVVGMPQDMYFWRFGIPLDRDHVYRLVVTYDNPTGEVIAGGGMGALGGVFVATGDVEWPAIDPRDPEYLRDMEVTLGQMEHSAMPMDESMPHSHPAAGGEPTPPGN